MGQLLERRWTPTHQPGLPRRAREGCTYAAYVPDRLADLRLVIDAEVAADIADAEREILSLWARGHNLATIEALSQVLLRAEAVASSRIEGLEVGARRLARAEIARHEGWPMDDETAADVVGNVAAVRAAVERGGHAHDISVDDLHALHRTLLTGERQFTVGAARRVQNWIGGSACNPCGAEFVPPPHDEVDDLLTDLVDYVNGDDHPAVVQAAIAHAQFETIHPYADGNGRVGRALIHIVLTRRRLAMGPVLPISLALATQQWQYIAGLTAFRFIGDPGSPDAQDAVGSWLEVFASACRRAVDDAAWLVARYDELIAGYRDAIGPVRPHSTVAQLLARLGELPVLTVELAAARLDRSYEATNNAIGRLVDVGALSESTGGRRNRVFEARELLELVTNAERRLASSDADTRVSPPVRRVPHRPG
jgi:Fic family protein